MVFVYKIFLMLIGSLYWSYLVRRFKCIRNTAVILIPQGASVDGVYAVELVEELMEQHGYDNAFFLTSDNMMNEKIMKIENDKVSLNRICRLCENALRQLYLLIDFDSRFYYASLNGLFRRNGDCLVGVKGLDRRYIFARGVYRISIKH